MDKWKLHFVLLIAVALLGRINADDFVDEDDEVTVETEQVEHPQTAEETFGSDIFYESPKIHPGKFHHFSHFDQQSAFDQWILSEAKKAATDAESKYDGQWAIEAPGKEILRGDLGLVLKSKARHSAISSRLVKPFVFVDKPFIVQYEVQLQDGQECGGAYIKLLSSGSGTNNLKEFHDKTPYTIMFGPDKCGTDSKLHFIFRHVNPRNGTIEEKHCKPTKQRLESYFTDKNPHLYRLVIHPDNTFTISIDHKVINEGSLLTDFHPAVNPPKDIADPSDAKPADWDDREKIPDPLSVKPEDWDENEPEKIPDITATKPDGWLDDEPELIADKTSKKPADWDDEMDGEWQAPLVTNPLCEKGVGCGEWKAPLIANPKYRGKWYAAMIDNVEYKGQWAARRIPNPDFFEDLTPFKMTPIAAVGIELWTMSADILFDNLLITDDMIVADEIATVTFNLKRKQLDLEQSPSGEPLIKVPVIENKPLWWTIYAIYCAIPFVIFGWYLWQRTKEESFIQRIVRLADERPWLWAVFVLAFGLPLSLFVYFRCLVKHEELREELFPRVKEKVDDLQPDDKESDAIEEEIEVDDEETRSRPRPASKLDLESPLGQEDDEENEVATDSAPKEGARKRRTRRE